DSGAVERAGSTPICETDNHDAGKGGRSNRSASIGRYRGCDARMNEAVAVEDSIYALSQPPYPIIPVHELYGTMLLEVKRPAEAMKHFTETLKRTPGRPKAIYGIARAAESLGDRQTAMKRYTEFLELWKQADKDRPEIAKALAFIETMRTGSP